MRLRITRRRAAIAAALLLPLAGTVMLLPSANAAVSAPVRVNANGAGYTDGAGAVWSADQAYTGGSWGYDTIYGASSTSHAIAGTSDQTLYQSYNLFNNWTGYKFDVPNGTYTVSCVE